VCLPGPGLEVASYDAIEEAESDRWKREQVARSKMNPFECGSLPMVTSFPEPILRDFLMDADITGPVAGGSWAAWWNEHREQLSAEQTARVWEAADKVRFFDSTEEQDSPELHAVVDVVWDYREGVHVADWDGGELVRVCRWKERAGEVARGRSQHLRASHAGAAPFANCRPCNVPDPFLAGSVRLAGVEQMPFSEALTIPFDDTCEILPPLDPLRGGLQSRNGRVFVVVRLDYTPGANGFRAASAEAGVPVKAFADWERARDYAEELEHVAREWFNPFRLGSTPEELSNPDEDSYDENIYIVSHLLCEMCRSGNLPVPEANDWERWWADHITPLPEMKRESFWRVLDRLQFYVVVSAEFEG
jgi:hypothetical protein